MAVINAANNGLWSTASTWPGSVFPTANDDVYANNRTIYIDQNITVKSLNTTQGSGGTAGGRFYQNSNIIANASVYAGTTTCLYLTGSNCTLSGAFFKGSDTTTSTYAVYLPYATTYNPNLTTYGTISGGSISNFSTGVWLEYGTLIHNGAVFGGTNLNCTGISVTNTALSATNLTVNTGPVQGGINTVGTAAHGISVNYSPNGTALANSLVTLNCILCGGYGYATNYNNMGVTMNSCNIPLRVNGNVYGGDSIGGNNPGVGSGGTGTITVSGNVYSAVNGQGCGIYSTGSHTLNVIGNVYASDSKYSGSNSTGIGIYFQGATAVVSITGNVYGAPGMMNAGYAVTSNGTGTCNIYGDVIAGSVGAGYAVVNQSTGTITIYGNVSGGTGFSGPYGAVNSSTGTLTVSGTSVGGTGINCHGAFNSSTGTLTVKRAKSNAYGYESSGINATGVSYGIYGNVQGSINQVEELEFGPLGLSPAFGTVRLINTSTNAIKFYTTSHGYKTLLTNTASNILPPVSSVVSGVSFNNNTSTGTMALPPASAVAYGLPVGNSTGTATLTPSLIWQTTNNTLTSTSLSGTIGYRLTNASTTETLGQQIAAYNG
jgi:hypothetical protein